MQEREDNNTLTNQTISKLLDFQNVPVPKGRAPLSLFQPTTTGNPDYADAQAPQQLTWPQEENRTLEKQTPVTNSKIFVVIAWILLLLTVWAVVGNLGFLLPPPLSFAVTERTYGHIGMFALAGCALSLTTWLCWKNKLTRTATVAVIIVILLSVSLPIFTMRAGDETAVGRLSRTLSSFSHATTAPAYELVTGILYSEDKPSAIIGSRIVHEGDTFNGITVVKVYKDKVEFEKDGRRWTQAVRERPRAY